MRLIDRVTKHEGFKPKPYKDHLGNLTFGHGLTWISEDESRRIVEGRLRENSEKLLTEYIWLITVPPIVLDVMVEMSFQMGIAGLKKFRKMWGALQMRDYETAANEMLHSKWARQTPERAGVLSRIIREVE